ncbi:MAG: hypothetical protein ACREDR_39500, partial [Blastocatellia bacterium]
MKLAAATFILLLSTPLLAAAQQSRPMSPPDRSPVPLTDQDQQRARAEELSKAAKLSASVHEDEQKIVVPGRHLSTGNPAIDSLVYEAAAKYKL